METTSTNDGLRQALAYVRDITALRDEWYDLGSAEATNPAVQEAIDHWDTDIHDRIGGLPLSVETRAGWRPIDAYDDLDYPPCEFIVLLSFGGPAVRIYGELPLAAHTIEIQGQDWGTPWESARLTDADREALLWFCAMVGLDDV